MKEIYLSTQVGFEPTLTELESAVLPLDDWGSSSCEDWLFITPKTTFNINLTIKRYIHENTTI